MTAPVLHRPARDSSFLLLIDFQEGLLAAVDGGPRALQQAERLLRSAAILGVPLAGTEQYPKGLGPTVEPLRSLLGNERIAEKLTFSSCGATVLMDQLRAANRRQVVLAGFETHVCVAQTALDLLAGDFEVFIVADAVSSRRPLDRQVALDRLRQGGAVVTTVEAVIFEWLQHAAAPEFKEVLGLARDL